MCKKQGVHKVGGDRRGFRASELCAENIVKARLLGYSSKDSLQEVRKSVHVIFRLVFKAFVDRKKNIQMNTVGQKWSNSLFWKIVSTTVFDQVHRLCTGKCLCVSIELVRKRHVHVA